MKILVVDDSATDRYIIENILSDYQIITACDGLEALQRIDLDNEIKLIILDLTMPVMDGFQVLRLLKENQRLKCIRVIILTSLDEIENELAGLKLGAVDYIRKPIHPEALKARIEIHIQLIQIQQSMEEKIYNQGLTFDLIFQQAPIGIAVFQAGNLDDNPTFDIINPMFAKIIGRESKSHGHLEWMKITHPDDQKKDQDNFRRLVSGEIDRYAMEKRYLKPDGSAVWVYMVVASLKEMGKPVQRHICLVKDISQRKAAEMALAESERNKSVLLSHLPGLAYRCDFDPDWTMHFVSEGCLNLTGYMAESLLNNRDISYNEMIAPEYRQAVRDECVRCAAEACSFKFEYEIITASGNRKWVLEVGEAVFNDLGQACAFEGIVIDISDRKVVENKLKFHYEHDSNTGLMNRKALEDYLNKDFLRIKAIKRAVISINLSPMQALSLSHGHHYTQELIRKTAELLKQLCSEKHILFCAYNNRFAFYIKDYADKAELYQFSSDIVKKMLGLLSSEQVGGGIGIIEIDSENGKDTDRLLKNLLITSEKAIQLHNADFGICFYDVQMEKAIEREKEIKRTLARIAYKDGNTELYLNYQPILSLKTGQFCGFEALARLNSRNLGFISPLEFIPVAEKSKLIIPVGFKIFEIAFDFLKRVERRGLADIKLSVNVSIIQLLDKDFSQKLLKLIRIMAINPQLISLEITESFFEADYDEMNQILGELKQAGLRISIDDFGTGYSTLSREQDLNVNYLKIDKSFIDKLMVYNPDEVITYEIISMAHKLGHSVIAEGIEHERQREILSDFGCDMIQGYLIGKPMSDEDALAFIVENRDLH
ncbi:EAL domain-containing protein [Eubacteriaceae bacterium ES2]|nr:EAL domain-containing protein [Eubacteriaceae bacterium ES2]